MVNTTTDSPADNYTSFNINNLIKRISLRIRIPTQDKEIHSSSYWNGISFPDPLRIRNKSLFQQGSPSSIIRTSLFESGFIIL